MGSPNGTNGAGDDVLQALDDLTEALRINRDRLSQIIERAEDLRRRRLEGATWSELACEEPRPLIVEVITQNMSVLASAGSLLRRRQARALHDEGMSMERIASLFGVTRQRVSELLRGAG